MANDVCKWHFKYIETGKYKYDTECGRVGIHQVYAKYCPFCGKSIKLYKKYQGKFVEEKR